MQFDQGLICLPLCLHLLDALLYCKTTLLIIKAFLQVGVQIFRIYGKKLPMSFLSFLLLVYSNMSLATKPTKWLVRPAMTQVSLDICPVWSVFTFCMKKAWVLSYPLNAQWRLWSDLADAQNDLSLHWAHLSFCRFCRVAAHIASFHSRTLFCGREVKDANL